METRIVNGIPYGGVQSITVGSSPFIWENPEAVRVLVSIVGGTLSTIQLSPDNGDTWMSMGLACGHYALNPDWQIKVSYILIPGSMSYTPF